MLAPLVAALLLIAPSAEGALVVPSIELVPAAARPGDAVLVRVLGAGAEPQGALAGRPLRFWREGEEWRALAALPVELAPGKVALQLRAGAHALGADLEVVEPGFQKRALTLPPKYVEPPAAARKRMEADKAAFARAFARPFEPPLFHAGFDWPRRDRTGGRFGDQRTLNGAKATVHYGIDLSGARGAPVTAADDGVVALTRSAYMSGNTLVLWHGAGVFSVYFHLDRFRVKEGERVKRGQRVGDVGATGRATGPHLHWGVKVDGLYVDPESVMAIDFERGAAPPRRAGPGPASEAPAPVAPVAPGPQAEPAASGP